jgi:hypothetical protein
VFANLLGWDTATWTAVATFALVIVTAVYVVLTWRLARAAASAAVASQRANDLQEALLDPEFSARYLGYDLKDAKGVVWVKQVGGPACYIHGAQVGLLLVAGDQSLEVPPGAPLTSFEGPLLPERRMRRGEGVPFRWPGPRLRDPEHTYASIRLEFSIGSPQGPRRHRVLTINQAEDQTM